MDEVLGYFLEQPRRLISLGRAAITAGMIVVITGLMGLLARTGASAIQGFGKATAAPAPSLSQFYPNLWTWWIPETLVGVIPALLLVAAGIWLVLTGRKLLRIYH